MALRINPGYKSLNLYFDQPTNAYDVDDVDTGGAAQVTQTDIRTDLQGLKVWIRSTSWEGASPVNGELYYDGPFQGYLAIDKLTQASTDLLANNTTYYIKYAFISKLQITEYTVLPLLSGNPSEATGTTLDVTSPIVGYLTRDPIEIPTDSNGSNPVYTDATGTFKVYRYGQDISTDAAVTYSVATDTNGDPIATGGVVAAFGTGENKNVYNVTAITNLTGTIKLTAKYTDPQNNANTITIEQILNVSKRRPGQTAPLVVLTATGQVFVLTEDSSGSTKNPSSVKLIATASNITNPTYTWFLDPDGTNTPIVDPAGTGTAGYTGGYLTGTSLNTNKDELTINSSIFTGATPQFKLFSVTVGSSVAGSTISVKDRMSVYYLKEGSDSLAMGLINENQTVTLNKTGTAVSGLPIESEAVVVEGTTQITAPAVTFAVNSQSGFNNTLTINTALNTPVVGKPAGYIRATQITANQATATITATVAGTTLSKVLTVNRVQDGADGTNIDAQLTNDFHTVPTAADGTGGVYTGASTTIEVYKNGVLQTSGFTFYVSGLQNVKYRGTGDTSDRTGTGETNGALTASSGTAVVNIVELSADSGYVDITAKQTTDSQLFTERFSLSRNKAGIIGKDAVIYEIRSNTNAITKASIDAGTDGAHTPSSIEFKVYKTIGNTPTVLTGGDPLYYIQWNSPVAEPTTNDTNAVVVPATGIIPAVTIANNSDYTSVNLKLLYKNGSNNYTQLDKEEIGVVFKGDKGTDGSNAITANLTNESHNIPVDRSGAPITYIGAETEISVEQAATNITASYTWTITASSNLDTTLQAHTSNQLNPNTKLRFGFTNNNTKATLQLMDSTVTSIIVRFTGTRTNYPNIVKDFTMVSVKPDISTLELSNDVHEFSATNAGVVSIFTGGSTSYSVKRNGVDESSLWTFTAQATSGITFSYNDTNNAAQSQNTTTAVNIYAAGTTSNRTISVTGLTTAFRTGTITITASRTNYANLIQTFSLSSILAGYTPVKNTDYFDGTNIFADLTNEFHSLPANNAGTISSYAGANTTIKLYKDGAELTSGVTYFINAVTNVTYVGATGATNRNGTGETNGALTTGYIAVDSLTADSGSIELAAKYNSVIYTSIFSLSKNKAGIGGTDSTIYTLSSSTTSISKASNSFTTAGAHTPNTITFSALKTVGNATPVAATDAFYTLYDSNGSEAATATAVPASGNISYPTSGTIANGANISSVTVKLYKDTNKATLLAQQTVPVGLKGDPGYTPVKGTDYFDGITPVKGTDYFDAYTIEFSKISYLIKTNSAGTAITGEIGSSGTAKTDITVRKGTTTLTAVAENSTPGTGQFKYVLGTVVNGTAARTDNDTFYLDTATGDSGSIPVTIYVEGVAAGNTYTRTISFAKAKDGAASTVAGPTGAKSVILYTKTTSNATTWVQDSNYPANSGTNDANRITKDEWDANSSFTMIAGQVWSKAPPSLSNGESQYEMTGTYPDSGAAGTAYVIWTAPYLSYFKVGSLDAITANIGTFTTPVAATTSTSRTVISGDTISIYSGSTLRVKIGKLT